MTKETIKTVTKCPTCGAECEIKSSRGGSTHWYDPKGKGVLEGKAAEELRKALRDISLVKKIGTVYGEKSIPREDNR